MSASAICIPDRPHVRDAHAAPSIARQRVTSRDFSTLGSNAARVVRSSIVSDSINSMIAVPIIQCLRRPCAGGTTAPRPRMRSGWGAMTPTLSPRQALGVRCSPEPPAPRPRPQDADIGAGFRRAYPGQARVDAQATLAILTHWAERAHRNGRRGRHHDATAVPRP
jgi:hypothetical protein